MKAIGAILFPSDRPDILISYLSPWIIKADILAKTGLFNVNFHPGPPEYPGIGCFNFAIYDAAPVYGVTAHIMEEKVDTGRIIAVKRFRIARSDSVHAVAGKSYEHMKKMFIEVMDHIIAKRTLPDCRETWRHKPYLRKDLEALCEIKPGMTAEEIKRRVKATTYPHMPGAYVDLKGYRFSYDPDR
jgi:methionyl-tRNA formyltransferase